MFMYEISFIFFEMVLFKAQILSRTKIERSRFIYLYLKVCHFYEKRSHENKFEVWCDWYEFNVHSGNCNAHVKNIENDMIYRIRLDRKCFTTL